MASFLLPSPCPTKPNTSLLLKHHQQHSSQSSIFCRFHFRSQSILLSSTKGLESNGNRSTLVKAQLNEVSSWHWFSFKDLVSVFRSFGSNFLESSVDLKVTGNGSSHAPATPAPKSAGPKEAKNDAQPADKHPQAISDSDASVSEFMAQVSSLVKLVNSRDVVELQLKQSDCELIIRKKEALPQPSPSPSHNVVVMHSSPSPALTPSSFPPTSPPALPPASSPTKSSAPSPAAGKPKSSQSPLKCPMAGTFYRCPAPGEPPFVKVGDNIQKGQIVCIIEAMKLMNEIEADRTGRIVEILVDDGKPVSVDMPLFLIEP